MGGVTFQELLAGFVDRFGSQTALGKAIEMSPSRINKVLKGRDTFDVANCLRLAEASGESPSVILRTAGKADVAELIERMYGAARPALAPALSPTQRELIEAWEQLPGAVQQHFGVLIRYARDVAVADGGDSRSAGVPETRRRHRAATTRTRAARRRDAKP